MADSEYESILCVKNEVSIYRIPPRTTSRGYRAADWNLQTPDWIGRMRICSKGKLCYIKIEDKTSGELFAKCNVDNHPGIAVEGVLDSSRYFVLRIEDDTGRHAFIGLGFADRGDSFDFNVALQDHFKWVTKSEEIEAEKSTPQPEQPKLDLAFKQGQTIHINIGNKSATSRPKPAVGTTGAFPPPPGSAPKLAPPPGGSGSASPLSSRRMQHTQQTQQAAPASNPLFSDFSEFTPAPTQTQQTQPSSGAEWGDFTSAAASSQSSNDGGWVQF